MVGEVDWGGLHNARDIGGAGSVPLGRIYRAPLLDRIRPEGWDAMMAAGVRTIIDL